MWQILFLTDTVSFYNIPFTLAIYLTNSVYIICIPLLIQSILPRFFF